MRIGIYGVQPSLFDSALNDFLDIDYISDKSALSPVEQLYSARGSQSVGTGTYVTDFTSTDPKDFK